MHSSCALALSFLIRRKACPEKRAVWISAGLYKTSINCSELMSHSDLNEATEKVTRTILLSAQSILNDNGVIPVIMALQ